MSTPAKKEVLQTIVGHVLPQQVPDAELLSGRSAADRFGLAHNGLNALPDIVAYSKHHNALFFIQVGAIGSARRRELHDWSSRVSSNTVHVSVFTSRKDYIAHMDEQAVGTFVWFSDEPKHHLFISGSPQASAEFLSARFAAK